ncbi:MAG: translocation/assembly module TamB domain-containing protein [Candidatus Margulisiibacteriota bacterium]
MKRAGLLSLLLVLVGLTCGFSVKDWGRSVYDGIKTEAEKSFSAMFNTPVKIESAGGIIVGRIELNGVTISGLGRAEQIVLTYNPLKYAFYKGDMVPALTKLTVVNGNFKIVRDRHGNLSLSSLLPAGDKKEPAAPAFHGWLIIKDCRAAYRDERGWQLEPRRFELPAEKLNGWIDLRGTDRVKFRLSGNIPEKAKVNGQFDLQTKAFELNVEAADIAVAKWANYTVPLPQLKAIDGRADVKLQLTQAKTPGWPVALTGEFIFRDGAAELFGYKLQALNGGLFIADASLGCRDLRADLNGIPVTLNGRFYDFQKLKLDLNVGLERADLKRVAALLPAGRGVDLTGQISGQIKISGTVAAPAVDGLVKVANGSLYGQEFSGPLGLSYQDKTLGVKCDALNLYHGQANLRATIDLAPREPRLKLAAKFSGLDLGLLAKNSPGVEGLAGGSLDLTGPFSALSGQLDATLSRSLVLGQPMRTLTAKFRVTPDGFSLDEFRAGAGDAQLFGHGQIGRNLDFDLAAEALGLQLAGNGALGPMRANLQRFQGKIGGKLDAVFLASPLKHLYASGEVFLVEGNIGDQRFDRAEGKIVIGGGALQLTDSFIRRGAMVIKVDGQTGLGVPTDLKVVSDQLELGDLPVITQFLPPDFQDIQGTASLEVALTGTLSRETVFTSPEQLLDLSLDGRLDIQTGEVAGLPLRSAGLKVAWHDRSLAITDCRVKLAASDLKLDLYSGRHGSLNATFEGVVELEQFQELTAKYGRFSGLAAAKLLLSGTFARPSISVGFRVDRFSFNNLYLDNVTGSGTFRDGKFSTLEPLLCRAGEDRYALTGQAGPAGFELELKILQANLGSAYLLGTRLQGELSRRLTPPAASATTRLRRRGFSLPDYQNFTRGESIRLYSSGPDQKYFLKRWSAIRSDFDRQLAKTPAENLGGNINGVLKINNRSGSLAGGFEGKIGPGYFRGLAFDGVEAKLTIKNNSVRFEQVRLARGQGDLILRGNYDLAGKLGLNFLANNLPLDTLQLFFPKKKFEGTFNLKADCAGPLSNLSFSLEAGGRDLNIAGVSFDQATLSVTKKNDAIYLHKLSLLQAGALSSAQGSLFLKHPGQLDLEANLQGNTIGLLNLLSDDIRWLKGESLVSVRLGGTLNRPEISGQISVNDGSLYLAPLDSELQQLTGTASIENNQLQIASLTGILTGKRTRNLPDPLGVAGTIDLSNLLAEKGTLDLDLSFSPTRIYFNLPNVFDGNLNLADLTLRGRLALDLSRGPTLKGKISTDNSIIYLSQAGGGGSELLPLGLDLETNIGKNVYAVMGDVATLNLSSIFMNMEIASTDTLYVTGLLTAPSLLGQIAIRRGTINIFNREFSLLPVEAQERFFPYDPARVEPNTAVFHGQEGAAGVMPELNITSLVNSDTQEQDASGTLVKKNVIILAKLKGTLGARSALEGLRITLLSFNEDRSKSPPEMIPANYSDQELKLMLLPDFVKSLAGLGQPGENSEVDSNVIVADYLSSRVSTILFRGLERQIEQKLGLESLTLEYNLGPKMKEALGIHDQRGFTEDKPAWSVGFVKGLFDRLYIDVRYSQGVEQTSAASGTNNNFNYQLTYKLTRIWSILYYREPMTVSDLSNGYQKVTLKAGFSFW